VNELGSFLYAFSENQSKLNSQLTELMSRIEGQLFDRRGAAPVREEEEEGIFVPLDELDPEELERQGYEVAYAAGDYPGGEAYGAPASVFDQGQPSQAEVLLSQALQRIEQLEAREAQAQEFAVRNAEETMMGSLEQRLDAAIEMASTAMAQRDAAFAAMERADLDIAVNAEDGSARFIDRNANQVQFASRLEEMAYQEFSARQASGDRSVTVHGLMTRLGKENPALLREHLHFDN
jgi:hypothetical protein